MEQVTIMLMQQRKGYGSGGGMLVSSVVSGYLLFVTVATSQATLANPLAPSSASGHLQNNQAEDNVRALLKRRFDEQVNKQFVYLK